MSDMPTIRQSELLYAGSLHAVYPRHVSEKDNCQSYAPRLPILCRIEMLIRRSLQVNDWQSRKLTTKLMEMSRVFSSAFMTFRIGLCFIIIARSASLTWASPSYDIRRSLRISTVFKHQVCREVMRTSGGVHCGT